jgi:hypothetical protein
MIHIPVYSRIIKYQDQKFLWSKPPKNYSDFFNPDRIFVAIPGFNIKSREVFKIFGPDKFSDQNNSWFFPSSNFFKIVK